MKFLITLFCASLVSLLTSYGFVYYAPLSWTDQPNHHNFGATSITTINGSDTLSSSRSTINNNFSSLNTNKVEISDLAASTSLTQLAKVGTITQGVWNGTAVTVPFGGTGSTTLSSNQVLLGNGTGIVKVPAGYGTTGQFLTSNGVGAAPTWTSGTFDVTANYTNTGQWVFNGATTTNLSVTNYLKWNTQIYTISSSAANPGTLLKNDGAGALTWGTPSRYMNAGASGINDGGAGNTFSTSSAQLIVPANILTGSSTITISGTHACSAGAGGTNTCTIFIRSSTGATFASFNVVAAASTGFSANWQATIIATSSTNQFTEVTGTYVQSSGTIATGNQGVITASGYSAINLANATTFTVVLKDTTNNNLSTVNDIIYLATP